MIVAPAAAPAQVLVDVGAVVDLRYARTDTERSWFDNGPGKLRYGAGVPDDPLNPRRRDDLLRLSQLSLLIDAEPSAVISAFVHINVDAEPDSSGFRARADLIEGFLSYHPDLSPQVQLRIKGGVFFPPVSLEHRGRGWTSPYTITGSAANSWIGEEVRTVGAEATVVLKRDRDELRLTGAGFGSNDPTGTLLGWRGWTLHDRQTGMGDRLVYPPVPGQRPGRPFAANVTWAEPMVEVDGRIGWYAGIAVERSGLVELRALRYDNMADQTVFDGRQYAWLTRFTSLGARLQLPGDIEVIAQHLSGDTHMGRTPAGDEAVLAPFETTFALLSVPIRRHRFSVRYDRFEVSDEDVFRDLDPNQENGEAWTVAYAFEATDDQRIAVELIQVDSDRAVRPAQGFDLGITENLLQVSWRLAF